MRKIKNKNIEQLLLELRFISWQRRQELFGRAQELLLLIDKELSYPFDFVCFRITGYHPKGAVEQPLINGDDLYEDLQIFVAKLSNRLPLPATLQKEKVYTVEQLARKVGVSPKTIHRWRRRGLLARKFVFEDGKRRVGVFQSEADKFLDDNPQLVTRARCFNRLDKDQKQGVIKRASALSKKSKLSRYQIVEQIANETSRAHETIRYTILDYEKRNPKKPVFPAQPAAISSAEAVEMYKLYKQGVTATELIKRFGCSKSSVYRIINRRRVKAILARKVEFITSDEFLEDEAAQEILTKPSDWTDLIQRRDEHPIPIAQKDPVTGTETLELAGESLLPEYLRRLQDTPALDRQQELELFRRYNYLKYLACIKRTRIHSATASTDLVKQVENYLEEAELIKNVIIEANLRLVVNIAMKHAAGGPRISELVSEGNYSLMRAVETFDYTRGFRFSTHASWLITKGFARKIPTRSRRRDKTGGSVLDGVHRDLRTEPTVDVIAVERARLSLSQTIKEHLNDREQYIILNHFGLKSSAIEKKKKTLKQIGDDLDLT
ncbi:MAG: helix-turn-helix domain-containing protein, partial [Planctomycetota bacterium]